jgi:tetratricopeptide (TPR) repeat protein
MILPLRKIIGDKIMFSPLKFSLLVLFLFSALTINAQTLVTAEQYVAQGIKFEQEKQFDKAAESFQQAIKLNPNLADAYHGLGAVYISMGRSPDALEPLKTAARLNPENSTIRLNLGATLSNLRRYNESISELNEAKRLSPNDGRIYNMFGNVYSNLAQFDDAIASYRKAIELNSEVGANQHNVGLMFMRQGKFSEAITPLQEALKISPRYGNARYLLSDAYTNVGRYKDASESWTKFLELVPNDPDALVKRSWDYLYAGEHGREASADARKFLEVHGWKDGTSPYIAIMANIGFRQAGMSTEAQAVIADASKKCNPDTWAYKIVQYFKGDLTGEELLKLATDNDKKTEAHAYMGMDLLLNGKINDARTNFEWVKEYGNKRFFEYPLAIEELKRLGIQN